MAKDARHVRSTRQAVLKPRNPTGTHREDQTEVTRTISYILLALCLLAASARAATIPIKPSGAVVDDTARIQAVFDAARPGDTVTLAEGTYRIVGQLRFRDAVTVRGVPQKTQLVRPSGTAYMAALPQNNAAVSGLWFRGASVYVTNANNLHIADCKFTNVPPTGNAYLNNGLYLASSFTNSLIERCEATDNAGNGIWIDSPVRSVFRHVRGDRNGVAGIHVYNHSAANDSTILENVTCASNGVNQFELQSWAYGVRGMRTSRCLTVSDYAADKWPGHINESMAYGGIKDAAGVWDYPEGTIVEDCWHVASGSYLAGLKSGKYPPERATAVEIFGNNFKVVGGGSVGLCVPFLVGQNTPGSSITGFTVVSPGPLKALTMPGIIDARKSPVAGETLFAGVQLGPIRNLDLGDADPMSFVPPGIGCQYAPGQTETTSGVGASFAISPPTITVNADASVVTFGDLDPGDNVSIAGNDGVWHILNVGGSSGSTFVWIVPPEHNNWFVPKVKRNGKYESAAVPIADASGKLIQLHYVPQPATLPTTIPAADCDALRAQVVDLIAANADLQMKYANGQITVTQLKAEKAVLQGQLDGYMAKYATLLASIKSAAAAAEAAK